MLLRHQAVEPNIDPGKKRDGDGSDQADREPASRLAPVEDGRDKCHDVEADQQDNADERGDPLAGHFFVFAICIFCICFAI